MPSAPFVLALLVGGLGCATTPSTTAGSPSSDEGKTGAAAPADEGRTSAPGTAAAADSPEPAKGGKPIVQMSEFKKSKDGWNAVNTLISIQPTFSKCYATSLKDNPGATGAGTILVKVDPDGEVTKALFRPSPTTPTDLVDCMEAAIKRTAFPAPKESATIDFRFWAHLVE